MLFRSDECAHRRHGNVLLQAAGAFTPHPVSVSNCIVPPFQLECRVWSCESTLHPVAWKSHCVSQPPPAPWFCDEVRPFSTSQSEQFSPRSRIARSVATCESACRHSKFRFQSADSTETAFRIEWGQSAPKVAFLHREHNMWRLRHAGTIRVRTACTDCQKFSMTTSDSFVVPPSGGKGGWTTTRGTVSAEAGTANRPHIWNSKAVPVPLSGSARW